jgi:DNA-directed RNA polymerase alpha subunit
MEQNKENTCHITLPQNEGIMLHIGGLGITLPQLTQAIVDRRYEKNPALCKSAIQSKLAHDLAAPVTVAFLHESLEALGYRLTLKLDQLTKQEEKDPELVVVPNPVNLEQILNITVRKAGFSFEMADELEKAGFVYIGDLLSIPFQELIKRIGEPTFYLVGVFLTKEYGIEPGTVVKDWVRPAKPSSQSARIKDLISRPIEDLKLMMRSLNCLHAGNVFYIGQLVQLNEAQLLKFINIGKHTVKDIVGQLEKFGLKLGMQLVGWNPPFDQTLLDKEISHLNLSTRASTSLKSIGVFYIGDLVQIPQKKLYVNDSLSQRSYEEIAKQVESVGLSFDMVVPDWKRPS